MSLNEEIICAPEILPEVVIEEYTSNSVYEEGDFALEEKEMLNGETILPEDIVIKLK